MNVLPQPKSLRNEQIYTYIVPGEPTPLARPRYSKMGRVWNPSKQAQLLFGISLRSQHDDMPFFTGPLRFEVIFYIEPPKKLSLKKQKLLYGSWVPHKPDCSNLLKFVEDAAIGVLYEDDRLLVDERVQKIYDKEPRTIIMITPL